MASTINTSRNESFFDGGTLTVDGGTLTVDGGTLTIGEVTFAVDDSTLMSDGQHRLDSAIACMTRQRCHQHDSMMTSRLCGQHRLSSAIVSMTRLRHHQAKQHPQDEDPILHPACDRVEFNKDHCSSCVDQGRKSLPSSYFIILSIFTWRSDQMSH
jgi:hypothetical protein